MFAGGDGRGRSPSDYMAAGIDGARAQVNDEIGAPDGLLIVLHDQYGIAEIAKLLQRSEQPMIVARVQSNGGLVEHIEHAAKPGADLSGQANALRLAARERGGRTVQTEVAQPYGEQKIQPLGDFRQGAAGYLALPQGEPVANAIDCGARIAQSQGGEIRDGEIAH